MTIDDELCVAAVQPMPVRGSVEDNVGRSAQMVARAADRGARLTVFPELSLVGYDLDRLAAPELWLQADDSRLDPLRDQCRTSATHTVVGAPVRAPDGRPLIASLFIDSLGELSVHGKVHLHGPEWTMFEPGGPNAPVDVDGWRAALAVCYDAAVPAHAQQAAEAGAELYLVSSWYAGQEYERMGIHLAARAMDHRMFAVGANYARSPDFDSCGGSGIWGPDGACERRASFSVEVVLGYVSRNHMLSLRRTDRDATAPEAGG
jgi:5-aminopentanamidase